MRRYIFSSDHKVVGLQYFFLSLAAVLIGTVLSLLMRFHLVWPIAHLPFLRGGIMTPEQYLALVTLHGTIMVFFVLTTAPQNAFGNYFLPLQIGAPEMAFPWLNMLSFWLTSCRVRLLDQRVRGSRRRPISGWTAYPPLSGLGEITGPGEGIGQTIWIVSILIFCVGSLLSSVNFIATTIDLRAPGMTLMRMPLTVWSWFVTAILSLLAFGVLLAGGVLLLLDRSGGYEFLSSRGLGGEWAIAGARGRVASAVAASVLVFRAPRGVHRDFAGHGRRFACAGDVFAQAGFWIPRHGRDALRDWRAGFCSSGDTTCS